jgi:hypothetical protein
MYKGVFVFYVSVGKTYKCKLFMVANMKFLKY